MVFGLVRNHHYRSVADPQRVLYTQFLPKSGGSKLARHSSGFLLDLRHSRNCNSPSAWWYVYRPLPQIDGSASLPGLGHEVTVERDVWGVPHIRAASVEDLAEAQGYVMAQDRLCQMDLLRRVARGQLSEILCPKTLLIDKEIRPNPFPRAPER